ncbi:sigma-54-dependent transcriptional regulator [Desulfobaculum bizertense]|uniref:DNA-binding transcriptional response regulator, NtrC family, contains REC, AAA-type ATPase, and a Fis-type DNA-binding domains n=1 Tax=Desulfobaculum bizertense DSM 18034 TaxID=1121442 RepID=A0A1T4WZ88_9BACT|nr:sigma-54 dependent transcriptional regulator [Desulfobaculum bizertense]SKA82477.1 DNA-binding transcriptional response regulator, NtrC family, contains REC, AAA-type ATPase, and a Fis-type DNA-binding domains [Desulfobaculum bizertense DSM 18034]
MHILLVDDDAQGRSFLAEYLQLLGHLVTPADSVDSALRITEEHSFELVLSDIAMPEKSGIDLIYALQAKALEHRPDIVLYTGHVDLQLAIDALRAGAFDYMTKPIKLDELTSILERVAAHQNIRLSAPDHGHKHRHKSSFQRKEEHLQEVQDMFSRLAGVERIGIFSEKMWDVVHQAEQYHTDRSMPVLIQGETGVGKEIIAKIIHYGTEHSSLPFVDINCTAISPTLFESELFGYESGAFTGGVRQGKKGKLDMAMGGTLFLDEIAEIPVELQAKLLRVIEERQFYRVGGLRKNKTDIRIIAATNLDFEKRIQEGLFRKDLYYRLKVGHITIPPLRERQEDIAGLALLFLRKFSKKRGKQFESIHPQAEKRLVSYHWPGNVRELKNLMEWVSFMHDGTELLEKHFVKQLSPQKPCFSTPEKKRVERKRPVSNADILAALEECGGNKTKASQLLGIALRTLYYRLDKMAS